ncbi:MAG: hypothetical protein LH473_11790, partial [Chitinophagales bacterium]|nr:hypothetical protein [Chitinophagales bacterium]
MKKYFQFTILFAFIAVCSVSCLITQQAKTGDMLFQEKKYTEAADLLQTELNKEQDPNLRSKKAFMIADCYRLSGQTIPAEEWYRKSNEFNEDQKAKFMYASMQKANEKYEEAVKTFTSYLKENPFDEEAKDELEACNQAIEWKKDAAKFTIENVSALNSNAFDYAPVFSEKNSVAFTSDRADAAGTAI